MRLRPALSLFILGTTLLALLPGRPAGGAVRVAFVGDLMLGRDVALAHANGDWRRTLEAAAPVLSHADLAFGNLESPLTAAPLSRPTHDLRASPGSAAVLARLGLDLLSLANNHALDAGDAGLGDTIQALRSADISFVGPSEAPWERMVEGLRIAFVAFDDTGAGLDLSGAAASVAAERPRADLLLISLHWGAELEPAANDRQRLVASALAAAGADIIVGHGPHVLQEVEWIWGPGRGRSTLVAYSLGNALFDSPAPPAARQSAVLIARLDRLGARSVCVVPLGMDPRGWDILLAGPEAAPAVLDALRSFDPAGEARLPVCGAEWF